MYSIVYFFLLIFRYLKKSFSKLALGTMGVKKLPRVEFQRITSNIQQDILTNTHTNGAKSIGSAIGEYSKTKKITYFQD